MGSYMPEGKRHITPLEANWMKLDLVFNDRLCENQKYKELIFNFRLIEATGTSVTAVHKKKNAK